MRKLIATTKFTLLSIIILMSFAIGFYQISKEAKADINSSISFDGKVTNTDGTSVSNGVYNMSFSLYSVASGGSAIWSEDLTAANRFSATISGSTVNASSTTYDYIGSLATSTLRAGQYLTNSEGGYALIINFTSNTITVVSESGASAWDNGLTINNRPRTDGGIISEGLGTVTSLSDINFNQTLYLEVVFNGEVMQPRKLITSAAQAFNSAKLGNRGEEEFAALSDNEIITGEWEFNNILNIATSSASAALTITQNSTGDIINIFDGSEEVFTISDGGYVGIGTTSPSVLLTIGSSTPSYVSGYNDAFISGSLEVSGTIYGNVSGTITPNFTEGSVVFADAFGNLTQNNPYFFWDNNNNNLGIGTSSPYSKLTVWGDGNLLELVDSASSTKMLIDNTGNLTLAGDMDINGTGTSTIAGNMDISQGHLMIYNNGTDTYISNTTGNLNITTVANKVIALNPHGIDTVDFIFGSSQLANTGLSANQSRMWFDKSKGAFRAGYASGTEWDDANVGTFSAVLGGFNNTASGAFSISLGGMNNTVSGSLSSVLSVQSSTVSGNSSAVLGGLNHVISGDSSVILGGMNNTVSNIFSAALGGFVNTVSGEYSVTLGGVLNTASGFSSAVLGGYNLASGDYSAVLGGAYSEAIGNYSMAMGQYLTADAANTIVMGQGISNPSRLINNTASSLMVGFGSDIPTLFVGPSSGAGTTGNVAIGTSSPYAKLSVWGDSTGTGKILELVDSASTTRMVVLENGNVGIGVENPSQELSVSGDGLFTGTIAINGASVDSYIGLNYAEEYSTHGAGHVFAGLKNQVTSLGYTGALNEDNTLAGVYNILKTTLGGMSGKAYGIYTIDDSSSDSGTQYGMYVDLDDPDTTNYALYVNSGGGDTYFGDDVKIIDNTNLTIGTSDDFKIIYDESVDDQFELGDGTNNFLTIKDQGSTADFAFNTNNLFIKNSGNVAIGTSSPYSKLTVWGDSTGTGKILELVDSASTTRMVVLENGNVGIGISNPSDTLSILGDVQIQSATDSTTGIQILDADGGTPILNIDTTNERVGIGVANPDQALEVNGNVKIETSSAPSMSLAMTSGKALSLLAGTLGAFYQYDDSGVFGIRATPRASINDGTYGGTSAVSAKFQNTGVIGLGGLMNSNANDYTGATIYGSAGGNVGIGTSSPYSKLTVWGDGNLLELVDSASSTKMLVDSIGNLTLAGDMDIDGTGTSTIAGNMDISQGHLMLYNNGTDTYISNTTGNLNITTAAGKVIALNPNGVDTVDFVFGSSQLADTGNVAQDSRMWFDQSKGAFRAGHTSSTEWDDANVGLYSAILGGQENTVSGVSSVALGGLVNTISGVWSAILGGMTSNVSGAWSTILGGVTNIVSGNFSSILGGQMNIASGDSSAVLGGEYNLASGDYSMTIGHYLTAGAANTIVIGQGLNNTNNLINNTASSLMAGFGSDFPTLFIGPSAGASTTGNVAIGTSSPYSKLTVWGDGNLLELVNNASSTKMLLDSIGNLTLAGDMDINGTATSTMAGNLHISGNLQVGDSSLILSSNSIIASSDFTISLGDGNTLNIPGAFNAGEMYVVNNGYIGIGTSSPYAKLSVWGDSTGTGKILELVDSASSTKMVVLENGNVGIGISNPSDTLSVLGDVQIQSATDSITGIQILDADGGTPIFNVDTTNERVGIGTASPSYPLHMKTTGSNGMVTESTGASLWNLFKSSAGEGDYGIYLDAVYFKAKTSLANGMRFLVSDSNLVAMQFLLNGDVGVGDETPDANFEVSASGGSGGAIFYLSSDDDNNGDLLTVLENGTVGIGTTSPLTSLSLQGTAGTPMLNIASSTGASALYVDEYGRVGMGTDSLSQTLTILQVNDEKGIKVYGHDDRSTDWIGMAVNSAGNGYLSSNNRIRFGINSFDTYTMQLYSTRLNLLDSKMITYGTGEDYAMGYISSDDTFRIAYGDDLTTAPIITLNASGNVGIGTTSPYAKLSVWGDSTGTGKILELVDSASTTRMVVLENGSVGIGVSNPSDTLSVLGNVQIQSASDSTTGIQFLDADGGTPIFNVDTTNERVGIGISAPTSPLHIVYSGADLSGNSVLNIDVHSSSISQSPAFTVILPTTGEQKAFQLKKGTDNYAWASFEYNVGGAGKPGFALGAGGASPRDVNIYRDSANILKTDDTIVVGGDTGAPDDLGDFDNYQIIANGGSDTGDSAGLLLTTSLDTYGGSAIVHYNEGSGGIGSMVFYTKQSTSAVPPVEVMKLTSGGYVAIGTSSPYAKLSVWGDSTGTGKILELVDSASSTRMVVLENGSVGIGIANPTQKLDIAEGSIDLDNTTYAAQNGIIYKDGTAFIHNFNYGDNGTVTTSGGNIFIGEGAGNFAMGSDATSVTHSSYNTGIGYGVLSANTIGNKNVAIGGYALEHNTTAGQNTAIGAYALSNNNTGGFNSAIGAYALSTNTTGTYNSALGRDAGKFITGSASNTTSNYSLYLGANTKALADDDQNEIVIGYNATGIGSNSVTLGNNSITTTALKGSVGIGTSSPYAKLSVWGDSTGTGKLLELVDSASSTKMVVLENGSVGIGTASPYDIFEISAEAPILRISDMQTVVDTSGKEMSALEFYSNDVTNPTLVSSIRIIQGTNHSFPAGDMAFYTGRSDTYGEKMRITYQNNVGLGDTSPDAHLEVSANGGSGGAIFYLSSNDGNNGDLLTVLENGNVGIGTSSPLTSLSLQGTAGTPMLNIASSTGASALYVDEYGNVGIGTMDPADTFQMNYNTDVSTKNIAFFDESTLALTGDLQGGIKWYSSDIGIGTGIRAGLYAETTTSGNRMDIVMKFGAEQTEKFRFSSEGSFRMIDDPDHPPSFYGQQLTTDIYINSDSSAPAVSFMNRDNSTTKGNCLYIQGGANEADSYILKAASGITTNTPVDRFIINGLGNVGIGTTSPYAKLSIWGDSTGTGKILELVDSASSTKMVVLENGYVGIGTISPTEKLEVSGIIKVSNKIKTGDGGVGSPAHTFSSDTDTGMWRPNSNILSFSTGASERLRIDVSGNIGIGTTSPYAKLSVWGDSTGTGKILELVDSASSTKMVVLENGNVGIGTVSPQTTLDINGRLSFKSAGGGSYFEDGYSGGVDLVYETGGGKFRMTEHSIEGTNDIFFQLIPGTDSGYGFLEAWGSAGMIVGTGNTAPVIFQVQRDEKMRIINSGNVGIGTSSPLTSLSLQGTAGTPMLNIASSTGASALYLDEYGNVGIGTSSPDYELDINGQANATGGWLSNYADYAEYYYTIDTDLEAGEAVCVDIERESAVRKCSRISDGNIMGIVSTHPGILGNNKKGYKENPNYVAIGMLGQVPAKVSTENGSIRPGDSLTSASIPGYIMRAEAGDPTVGVALEKLESGSEIITSVINVLISRRNKSITVEEVEEKVTERIAAMEIEDEVNILIANAINSLNLDDEINEVIDPRLLMIETKLTVQADDLTGRIENTESDILVIANSLLSFSADLTEIINKFNDFKIDIANNIIIDNEGNIKIGDNISTSTPSVAIVEINTASTTSKTAFVINQEGEGNIADFKAKDVSVMNIESEGKVVIVGEMMVDGRIMVCSGGSCGTILDNAVDETMGDIGIEGKVVAGAFEGYCDEGFIWVPGSAKYGTMPGFCVMEREASAIAGSDPISSMAQEGDVWVNISQGEAQLACQRLGNEYHLISENEWLTIADNIIKVAENDIDAEAISLQLATSSAVQTLINGNTIYNIAGGIDEWVDEIISQSDNLDPLLDAWQEYYEISSFKSLSKIRPPYYLTSENGIGKIFTGSLAEGSSLRGFVRGFDGIYGLDLSNSPTTATSTIGFRCAK